MVTLFRRLAPLAFLLAPTLALAQAAVDLGVLRQDSSQPVEVASDSLRVDQPSGRAVFTGNVHVAQGKMKLQAAKVEVEYAGGKAGGSIARLHATGGVTVTSGGEAAESDTAVYTLESGELVMSGDVLLTQGPSAISGDRLVVDLDAGTGEMQGRVRTVLQGGDDR